MIKDLLNLSILFSLVLITACTPGDDEKECTDTPLRGLNVTTGAKYREYYNGTLTGGITDGNITNLTYYENGNPGGRSSFFILNTVKHVCKKDVPLISTNLSFFLADANIKDTVTIFETGKTPVVFGVTASGATYELDYFYPFDNSTGEAELRMVHQCSFPGQGNAVNDSIYFFDQLVKFSTSIAAKDAPQ